MELRSWIKQICKGHGVTWQWQITQGGNFKEMSNGEFRKKC